MKRYRRMSDVFACVGCGARPVTLQSRMFLYFAFVCAKCDEIYERCGVTE